MDKYPDFIESTGYGTGEGLCGWNCYHSFSPFIPGVSVPTYTAEQLEEMNRQENTPKEYQGKQYTAYQATQRQRRLETQMRAERQKIHLLQVGGADEKDITSAKCRYRATSAEYARFSKAMDLPQQRERVTIDGLGDVRKTPVKVLGKPTFQNNLIFQDDNVKIKNIVIPEEEILSLKGMTNNTKIAISNAIEKLQSQYNIKLNDIVITSLGKGLETTPFQYNPKNSGGFLVNQLYINSDYYFNDSLEAYEARIMRNYNKGVLAAKSIEDLIAHEMAHIMTFQSCETYGEFVALEEEIRGSFVRGVSLYADSSWDGAETIAEAFVRLKNNESVPEAAKLLVEKYIERWRKK